MGWNSAEFSSRLSMDRVVRRWVRGYGAVNPLTSPNDADQDHLVPVPPSCRIASYLNAWSEPVGYSYEYSEKKIGDSREVVRGGVEQTEPGVTSGIRLVQCPSIT